MLRYFLVPMAPLFIIIFLTTCGSSNDGFVVDLDDQRYFDASYEATADAFQEERDFSFQNRLGEKYVINVNHSDDPRVKVSMLAVGDGTLEQEFGFILRKGMAPEMFISGKSRTVANQRDVETTKIVVQKFNRDMIDLLVDLDLYKEK